MAYQTRLFINNEYVTSKANKTFPVYNPVDNSHVADVQAAGQPEIDAAVAAAQAAYDGPWSAMKKQDRGKCMLKLADLVEARAKELSKLHTICMGMPYKTAYFFTLYLTRMLRYYAGLCDKISGETHSTDADGVFRIVNYEPYGVCAGLGSWNGGYLYEGLKMAPAIAAGNTVIFKASEKAPLASLALGELVIDAGFPPGVCQFVAGGQDTGALISSHMQIRKLAFTGTARVGRLVQIAAAKSNFKSLTLELSGKSPVLVFEDADITKAIEHCSKTFLVNSGQICAATARILVHNSVASKLITGVKQAFQALGGLAMGDPMAESTFLGPLADTKHFDMVMNYVNEGKKEGIELLAGGDRKGDKGNFLLPTLFLNPDRESKMWKDDIFGPVGMIRTFKDEDGAIELANDTEYGLSAVIFTPSYARALRVSKKLQCGSCGINGTAPPFHGTPFGGWKSSGYGREGGREGLMNYLQTKTVAFNGI